MYCGPMCPISAPAPSGACDYMYHLECAAKFQGIVMPLVNQLAAGMPVTEEAIMGTMCPALTTLRDCYNDSQCPASFVTPVTHSLDVTCTAVGCPGCATPVTIEGRCELAPVVSCSRAFAMCIAANPANFCACRESFGTCLNASHCLDNGTMIASFYAMSGLQCTAGLSECNLIAAAQCIYQQQLCITSSNPCDCVQRFGTACALVHIADLKSHSGHGLCETHTCAPSSMSCARMTCRHSMGECLMSARCLNMSQPTPLTKAYEDMCSLAGCSACPGVTCQPGAAVQCLNAAKDCVLIAGHSTCQCVSELVRGSLCDTRCRIRTMGAALTI